MALDIKFNSPESLLASFINTSQSGALLLITGEKGAGKTHFCMRFAQSARQAGIDISGLVTTPVFENGQVKALQLINLENNKKRTLATRREGKTQGPVTQNWQFDLRALAWGNSILRNCHHNQIFILDELGPLEFQYAIGLIAAFDIIDSRRYQLACVVIRPSLLKNAHTRWSWGCTYLLPQGELIEV